MTNRAPNAFEPFSLTLSAFRAGSTLMPLVTSRRFRGGFVGEVISELRKVVWPSQEEATRLTVMVLVISISIGIALGVIDFGFSNLIQFIL